MGHLKTNIKKLIFDRLPEEIKTEISNIKNKSRYSKKYLQNEKNNPGSYYSLNAFYHYNCIFVHIPKTGGVSVSKSLFGNLAGGHKKIKDYEKKTGKILVRNFYKFTFVRNPWDRLLSSYTFLKKGGYGTKDELWFKQNLHGTTFESFVLNWLNKESMYEKIHFHPQLSFITNKQNKIVVDYIARFENIAEEYDFIKDKLGIEHPLLHLNKTNQKKKNYKDHYTKQMREKVHFLYSDDINSFNYTF